jgi:hypothetical protein
MLQLSLYDGSQRLARLAAGLIETVHNGFWLGVLSYRSLVKVDETYYVNAKTYRSAEYNRKGLLQWEKNMVEQYFRSGEKLLVIGAGGGREVIALQKMGFSVRAFECNETLQVFGNELLIDEDLDPCIELMGRDLFPKDGPHCDGAIVGWGTYTLIQGSARRVALLNAVRSQIADGGCVLLSFFARSRDSWQLQKTAAIGNFIRFILRREPLSVGDSLAPNYVHYFTEAELSAELDMAGFELQHYSEKGYGHAVARIKTASSPGS